MTPTQYFKVLGETMHHCTITHMWHYSIYFMQSDNIILGYMEVPQIFANLSNITALAEITGAIQLNEVGEGLMNTISHFRAIYQMQQSLAGNLLNLVVRNQAKVHVPAANKNCSIQNYATVQDSTKLLRNKQTYHFKISSKTLGKSVNLANIENIRMTTYDFVIYLVFMWNEIMKYTHLEQSLLFLEISCSWISKVSRMTNYDLN